MFYNIFQVSFGSRSRSRSRSPHSVQQDVFGEKDLQKKKSGRPKQDPK